VRAKALADIALALADIALSSSSVSVCDASPSADVDDESESSRASSLSALLYASLLASLSLLPRSSLLESPPAASDRLLAVVVLRALGTRRLVSVGALGVRVVTVRTCAVVVVVAARTPPTTSSRLVARVRCLCATASSR
jgi:hypothetical protein